MKTITFSASRSLLVALLFAFCSRAAQPQMAASPQSTNRAALAAASSRVRNPAVAGLFYPADAAELSKTLDRLLNSAPEGRLPGLKALICPHAGYDYSGPAAAIAYKILAGTDRHTAIVMGPSHYAWFKGACIPNADAYRTPLGLVPISAQAKILASTPPFVLEPICLIQRPPWASQGLKALPEPGQDTPETWEHSVEVQIPFLQKVLQHFELVPIVIGESDPQTIANALSAKLDDTTVVVASSDLSHYHPYNTARDLDNSCIKAICDGNLDQMKTQEACGKSPILVLMHLARLKGWKAQVLDYRNSGDATGDKDRVVGYTAIAFCAPKTESLSVPERKSLLEFARTSLERAAAGSEPPAATPKDLPAQLIEKKACFVTLTKAGALRGCIGHLTPSESLYQAVVDNARSAALRDPRFPAVQSDEVSRIKIEISVLTEPQPLPFASPDDLLGKLRPGQDGVLLRIGQRSATFLPQVWTQLPDKVDFLNHLAQKAGCETTAWRGPGVTVSIYHVECFEEEELPARGK
jgi:MEMO1 family protein